MCPRTCGTGNHPVGISLQRCGFLTYLFPPPFSFLFFFSLSPDFSNSRSSGKADDGEEEGVAEAGMANVQDEVNSVFQRHAEMHTRTLVQQSKEITTKTATATEAPPPPPKGGAASDWEGYAWLLHHAIESVPPEPEQVVYTGWVGGVEPDAEDSASTAGYSHGMYCWSSVQQCRISVATMRSALAVGGGGGGGGGNGYGKPEAPPQAASTAPSNNSNKARTLVRVNLFEPVARNLQAFAGMTTESIRPDCVVLPPFFSFEVERISSVDSGKLSIIQCLQKCAAPGAQAAGLNLGAFAQDFSPKWWNKPGRKAGKAGKAGQAASKSRNANAAAAAAAATAGSSAPTTVTESAGGSSAETSPPVRRAGGNGSLRQIRAVAVKKATARAKQHTNGSSTASSSSSSLFAPGAGGAGRGRAGGQGAAPSAGRAGAAAPSALAGAGAATARAQRVFGDEGEEGPRGFHPALHGNRASLSEHEGRPNARALRSNAMGSYDDAVVYTDSPLMLNDEYVLQFHVLVDVPHTTWSGSLELGLAPNLPASRSDIPESLAGSDDIVTPDCDQLFDAEGLESGDVVTFRWVATEVF